MLIKENLKPLHISIQTNIIEKGPKKYYLCMDQTGFLKSSILITVI